MRPLTEKQQLFVNHRSCGMGVRQSALAAGYAPGAADVQGAKLMSDPRVRSALNMLRPKPLSRLGQALASKSKPKDEEASPDKLKMPRAHYADPIDFLTDVMNHKQLPVAVRADAAKQLLPYKHARIGEKGKKESAKDRAREIAGGVAMHQKPRFQTKTPPKLHVVENKDT